jgi:hypothetical protein
MNESFEITAPQALVPEPAPAPLPAASGPAARVTQAELDALRRLDAVRDSKANVAALLTMLLTAADIPRVRSWREETALIQQAEGMRQDVEALGLACRLPWFEHALLRHAGAPLEDRKFLLQAARRLMKAARPIRPMDWLLFLAMRHSFGEVYWAPTNFPVEAELAELPAVNLRLLCRFTAHLAQLVPGKDLSPTGGQRWYQAVVRDWNAGDPAPEFKRPDIDELIAALACLHALSSRQRLELAKLWVTEALELSGALTPSAAEALRLSCLLMDCTLPRELDRLFIEIVPASPD